jgi:hypothetical protein
MSRRIGSGGQNEREGRLSLVLILVVTFQSSSLCCYIWSEHMAVVLNQEIHLVKALNTVSALPMRTYMGIFNMWPLICHWVSSGVLTVYVELHVS